jgi:5-methylcytosine-specific restriction endonuclease McrA
MLCLRCNKREGRTPGTKYCNSCAVARYRVSHPDYYRKTLIGSANWQRLHRYDGNAKKALERDRYICRICGIKPFKPNVHHLDGKGSTTPKELQNNTLNNLVTLCQSCHQNAELYAGLGLRFKYIVRLVMDRYRLDGHHRKRKQIYIPEKRAICISCNVPLIRSTHVKTACCFDCKRKRRTRLALERIRMQRAA